MENGTKTFMRRFVFISFMLIAVFFCIRSHPLFVHAEDGGTTQTSPSFSGYYQIKKAGEQNQQEEIQKGNDGYSFGEEYTGNSYTIVASFQNTTTGNTYKWYFKSPQDQEYTETEYTNNLSVKNVSDSGLYYCTVLDDKAAVASSNDSPLKVTITPKKIEIISLTPTDRPYDGTTVTYFTYEKEGDICSGDNDSSIVAMAEVTSPDADEGKAFISIDVSVKKGESLDTNYSTVPSGENKTWLDILTKNSVTITPTDVLISNWENKFFTYTGKSHLDELNFFYTKIDDDEDIPIKFEQRTPAVVDMSGSWLVVKEPYLYKNAGKYTLSIVRREEDRNYKFIKNDHSNAGDITVIIQKGDAPTLDIRKKNFIYTGEEQDLADFISISTGQPIVYYSVLNSSYTQDSNYTKFKDVNDFRQKFSDNNFKIKAQATENYNEGEYTNLGFSITKAEPVLELPNVLEFKYNGNLTSERVKNELVNLNSVKINNESSSNFDVTLRDLICNVGEYKNGIKVNVAETNNYLHKEGYISVRIIKSIIDVGNSVIFRWSSNPKDTNFTYNGEEHEVRLQTFTNRNLKVTYIDNKKVNAGSYVASVKYELVGSARDNYEIQGETKPLAWNISKKQIPRPQFSDPGEIFYTGKEITLEVEPFDKAYVTVKNNVQKNAGQYEAVLSLKDKENCEWFASNANGRNVNDIVKKWEIKKQKLDTPKIIRVFTYDGAKHEPYILGEENLPYYVVSASKFKDVGNYEATCVLRDQLNYEWKDSIDKVLFISWQIVPQTNNRPLIITSMVMATLAVVGLGFYFTLQYTIVRKRSKAEISKKKQSKNKKQTLD